MASCRQKSGLLGDCSLAGCEFLGQGARHLALGWPKQAPEKIGGVREGRERKWKE